MCCFALWNRIKGDIMKQIKILKIEIDNKDGNFQDRLREIITWLDGGYVTGLGWDIVFEGKKAKQKESMKNCEYEEKAPLKKCVELKCNLEGYHYACKDCIKKFKLEGKL